MARCEHEAAIMEWVRRQGYPVPVVIDWGNTDVGSGSVDTALSAVILAQAALVPAGLVPADVAPLIRALVEAFLRHTGPLETSDVDEAIRYRSSDPSLSPTETAALDSVAALLRSSSPAETSIRSPFPSQRDNSA